MLGTLLAAATLVVLTPQQKAGLLVVSGLPAPKGVGGILVQRGTADAQLPPGVLVFADQEGGDVRAFPALPPAQNARDIRNAAESYADGVATARALRTVGVDVDLAPVLDLPDGPLGAREFSSPLYGIAFARGLLAGGVGTCSKHFPGLGPLPASTDVRPYDRGVLRDEDVAPYRNAVEAQLPCVMVGHGIYDRLGPRRAVLEPTAYQLLRSLRFEGVAITDSLSIISGHAAEWAVAAVRAGADLVLFTSGHDAAEAMRALAPLARRGELDAHAIRVLRFRERLTD